MYHNWNWIEINLFWFKWIYNHNFILGYIPSTTQMIFTCSESTMKTPEHYVKFVNNKDIGKT